MIDLVLDGGVKVQVNMTTGWGICRGCGKRILWALTGNGKLMPVIKIGEKWVSHFSDCPKSGSFRKPLKGRKYAAGN
jgi:hypothetical protein